MDPKPFGAKIGLLKRPWLPVAVGSADVKEGCLLSASKLDPVAFAVYGKVSPPGPPLIAPPTKVVFGRPPPKPPKRLLGAVLGYNGC